LVFVGGKSAENDCQSAAAQTYFSFLDFEQGFPCIL